MPRPTREMQREYQRQWIAKRRQEWMVDKACVRCGSCEDLHVHHRDPAEKVAHSVWSWSAARREAELAKCEVLCRPCHEEHHASEWRRHGTPNRYKKGCRCDLCRRAKAKKTAAERARRKLREAARLAEAA